MVPGMLSNRGLVQLPSIAGISVLPYSGLHSPDLDSIKVSCEPPFSQYKLSLLWLVCLCIGALIVQIGIIPKDDISTLQCKPLEMLHVWVGYRC